MERTRASERSPIEGSIIKTLFQHENLKALHKHTNDDNDDVDDDARAEKRRRAKTSEHFHVFSLLTVAAPACTSLVKSTRKFEHGK